MKKNILLLIFSLIFIEISIGLTHLLATKFDILFPLYAYLIVPIFVYSIIGIWLLMGLFGKPKID